MRYRSWPPNLAAGEPSLNSRPCPRCKMRYKVEDDCAVREEGPGHLEWCPDEACAITPERNSVNNSAEKGVHRR